MKHAIAALAALALIAPAFAQAGPVIGPSPRTQKPPSLAEARACAAATGYWVTIRRAAKQPSRIYETSLEAWSVYIQNETHESPAKVQADIMADVQARAKSRDASWALDTRVACAAFEKPPAPPSALADQPTP